MPVQLYHGDNIAVLKTFEENSVDAVVTDPPYGLSFMNRQWDHQVPSRQLWQEVLRVLRPGGHLLSFAGTRTYHRMVVNIEDAGFEIRDQIGWLYSSGFPHSHNVGGFGTNLKPAWEPICLARKPSPHSVKETLQQYGTGALNIDDCRVETSDNLNGGAYSEGGRAAPMTGDERTGRALGMFEPGRKAKTEYQQPKGRWPANIIHDGSDEVMAAFAVFGERKSGGRVRGTEPSSVTADIYGKFNGRVPYEPHTDTGTAARFFFSAKAKKEERAGSNHPTIKPIALMRYLVRLITPPQGVVLDPFAGTGTTAQAALEEGMSAILVEREDEYVQDIRRRVRLFIEEDVDATTWT